MKNEVCSIAHQVLHNLKYAIEKRKYFIIPQRKYLENKNRNYNYKCTCIIESTVVTSLCYRI